MKWRLGGPLAGAGWEELRVWWGAYPVRGRPGPRAWEAAWPGPVTAGGYGWSASSYRTGLSGFTEIPFSEQQGIAGFKCVLYITAGLCVYVYMFIYMCNAWGGGLSLLGLFT